MQPLLEIKNLSISVKSQKKSAKKQAEKPHALVTDINLNIFPKQTVALLGETGSGKSLTALSVLQLLSNNLIFGKDSGILLEGKDLFQCSEIQMRKIRGGKIAMVF